MITTTHTNTPAAMPASDMPRFAKQSPGIVRDPALEPILAKVDAGERLTRKDGLTLYESPDIWTICELADRVRRRVHGDIAYYNVNQHINYSNLCALSCKFCAFHRKKGQDGAYEMTPDEIKQRAIKAREQGATELHIVGGLHPWLKFDYYTNMLAAIREATPELHIKAFTAVEIVHLARISKRGRLGYEGLTQVLSDLIDAGLGSLPGGGAEVFDDRVHDEAFKGKIRSDEWLDVHRAAHELGLNSNATMLYGHVEQRAERITHMCMLREAQDVALARIGYDTAAGSSEVNTTEWPGIVQLNREGDQLPLPDITAGGYFQTLIPLPFFPDESELQHLPGPTGLENLRTLAIARLMLDNFPHIKAFWIMQTLGMAQFMLQNGADDIDGTVVWYDITKLIDGEQGVSTHQEVTVWELQKAIREAGFSPVERDTLYRTITRDADDATKWSVAHT